jgi:hypothetical protein
MRLPKRLATCINRVSNELNKSHEDCYQRGGGEKRESEDSIYEGRVILTYSSLVYYFAVIVALTESERN